MIDEKMVGKIIIDAERCKGCGLCIGLCPKNCIIISDKSNKYGYFPAQANNNDCTGCGLCAIICPETIIEVYRPTSWKFEARNTKYETNSNYQNSNTENKNVSDFDIRISNFSKAAERILMCGNEALSEAAIRAGLDAYFGYPITPQNEITAYMSKRMPQLGRVFVQSESELSAINMVFGASATGKRAMTSSSSPGISLMQEGLSYLAATQLPAVVVNVMRGGPGLGNIAPSQADYFQATRGGGHGDYRTIVLAPASVQELVDCMPIAFDLADQYRMTVMVLIDGILGQMMEPVVLGNPKSEIRNPKFPKDWALTGKVGRKQNIIRSLLLNEGALEELNYKLAAKYQKVARNEVRCEQYGLEDAQIVVVAYGIAARIVRAAVAAARAEKIKAGAIRPITLWPFPTEQINQAADQMRIFLVVEMSCGQMVEDVKMAVAGKAPVLFYGRPGGGVPTVEQVLDKIRQLTIHPVSRRSSLVARETSHETRDTGHGQWAFRF